MSLEPSCQSEIVISDSYPIVIYDTNIYRQTARDPSIYDQIKSKEIDKGLLAVANCYSLVELIVHLESSTDPAYEDCLNAIINLTDHTINAGEHGESIRIIESSESAVCRYLFGYGIGYFLSTVEILEKISIGIRSRGEGYISSHRTELSILSDFRKGVKDDFVEQLRNSREYLLTIQQSSTRKDVIKAIRSQEFLFRLACDQVVKHAQCLKIELIRSEIEFLAKRYICKFKLPLELYRQHYLGLLHKNLKIDKPKVDRSNDLLDYYISHIPCIQDSIIFVTNDKNMLKVAKNIGLSTRVLSLEAYLFH